MTPRLLPLLLLIVPLAGQDLAELVAAGKQPARRSEDPVTFG